MDRIHLQVTQSKVQLLCTALETNIHTRLSPYALDVHSNTVTKLCQNCQNLSKLFELGVQLLKAVALRQRLRTTYEHTPAQVALANQPSTSQIPKSPVEASNGKTPADVPGESATYHCPNEGKKRGQNARLVVDEQHEHSFPEEDQTYNSDTRVRMKRCPCGFSLRLEEM